MGVGNKASTKAHSSNEGMEKIEFFGGIKVISGCLKLLNVEV